MAYTVTIKYTGKDPELTTAVAPISRIYSPDNSYIDTDAYEVGNKTGGYGKSQYATNVNDKFGFAPQVEPYASTSVPFPVPLAQFKMAAAAAVNGNAKEAKIDIEVEDYKEALYYQELGTQLADQGFEIEVKKN